MGGGLMQLVAYGAQDIYLTGNPQITFFKVVYRRHTNFAMESIHQTFNGAVNFGSKVSCTISRNGDLVSRMYLEVLMKSFEIPNHEINKDVEPGSRCDGFIPVGSIAKAAFMNKLGNGMIKHVECEIGGQLIDRQYGEWMDVWAQLTHDGYGDDHYNYLVTTDAFCVDDQVGDSLRLFIPLQFWFCNNPGLALPLIALQYHEVKINLWLEELKNVVRFDFQAGYGENDGNVDLGAQLMNTDAIVTTSQLRPLSEYIATPNGGHPAYYELPACTSGKTCNIPTKNTCDKPTAGKVCNNYTKMRTNICEYIRDNWQELGIQSCQLYCDYIYLDTDERRRFAQVSHEYLITQVQFTGATSVSQNITNVNVDLDLNHPVKELLWVVDNDPHLDFEQFKQGYQGYISTCAQDPADKFQWLNNAPTTSVMGAIPTYGATVNPGFYIQKSGNVDDPTSGSSAIFQGVGGMLIEAPDSDPNIMPEGVVASHVPVDNRPQSGLRFWDQLESAVLQLNGHDRFSRRVGRYFKWVQTYQHHDGPEPGVNNLYCYSFALKPQEHQPSGTCNFSRIDNATLNLSLFKSILGPKNFVACNSHACPVDRRVRVYATNYNVLRVMSGMGGLAYSN